MRLMHSWVPPVGTTSSACKWKNEWVYTRVYGETRTVGGEAQEITRYGLWFVDPESGRERLVEAPFYRERSCRGDGFEQKWLFRGVHEGRMVLTLGLQQSYDIGYHVFTTDGKLWSQVKATEGRWRTQEFVLSERDFKVWDAPGALESEDIVIAGGELLSVPDPLRFAVDNTHAFAYDSGPDSPRSEAYLRALEELENLPTTRQPCSKPTMDAVLSAIPAEIRQRHEDRYWRNSMLKRGNSVWVSEEMYGEGFLRLMRFSD